MKILIAILVLSTFLGCNQQPNKSEVKFFPIEERDFKKYINQKSMPTDPNLAEDIHIINNDYPIEISIYKDGRWYYNLDNLDDGHGTWHFRNGRIQLFAERTLFDMHIDLESIGENGSELVIKFSDRFGPKTLNVKNRNIIY